MGSEQGAFRGRRSVGILEEGVGGDSIEHKLIPPSSTGGATYYSVLYYVPIFFQTVQGSSPVRSGVQTIAIVLPSMLFGTLAGAIVSRYGSWHWEMLFGTAGTAVAAGLFATMTEETSAAKWIGYQVLAGAAMGALYM